MKKTADNELEHLLRTSADEIRLHPSPKVWKGINSRLQRRKKTYRAAILLLLLIGLTVGLYTTSNNGDDTPVAGVQNVPGNNPDMNRSLAGNKNNATAPVNTGVTTNGSLTSTPVQNVPVMDINDDERNETVTPGRNANGSIQPVIKPATVTGNDIIAQNDPQSTTAIAETPPVVIKNDLGAITDPAENRKEEGTPEKQSSASFTKTQNSVEENITPGENNSEKITAENKNINKPNPAKEKQVNRQEEFPVKDITDANIRVTQKLRRFTTEFYVVPSISYRKLVDSRDPNGAGAFSKEDFDKAVFHKPSLGLEAGVSWHYRVYDRFRAKAGLQVNYNRFNMKATRAPQPELARIVLYGNNQDVQNTSSLRTDNEHGLVEWIRNKNLQISVPIGFEVAVTTPSRGNTTLNIGTTVQPSYLLGNKNYLLSTDLKNYTTEPSLVRRFNVNLGFETFFAFETKKLRWHLGPQLRYQLFSTYNKIYPYKENLIDYTFKVSISKPF